MGRAAWQRGSFFSLLLVRFLFLTTFLILITLLRAENVYAGTFPSDPDLRYFAGDDIADTAVSRVGEKFKINGTFTYAEQVWKDNLIEGLLLNSRMVNGVYDDLDGDPPSGMKPWNPLHNTQDFIAQMPGWRDQGLVGFTINLQGGSNRCNGLFGDGQSNNVKNNPYGSNGTQAFSDWYANNDTAHARYLARLGSVIRAADDLGMVVILGLFYFGQDELLANNTAVKAAVDAVTDWVLDNKWTNVLIEINNEADIGYNHTVLQPARVHELMQQVKTRSSGAAGVHLPHGRLLVSSSGRGGFIPSNTWISNADFVLLHGNGQTAGGIRAMVDQVREKSSWQADPKPIVFNEDSTNTENFVAAVEQYASWGYFDNDGYQCVYDTLTTDRWTVEKATNPAYWPLLAEMAGLDGLPPGSMRLEAEELELSGGYEVDSANPEWITIPSASQGEALGVFPGPDGEYQVTVHAIAEDDGQPELELWIGGGLQAVFTYPLGSSSREPVTLIGPTLFLTTGTEIRLVGHKDTTSDGTAHARVDEVRFAAINPPDPPDEPPPGATFIDLEAEELELSGGYEVDSANPEWITIPSASQGEALGVFPGPDGEYQVTVHAIAEDDGQPELELWIGGGLQAVFTYPLGSSSREPVTLIGPTLFLTTGTEIRLVGYKDTSSHGTAHARVDEVRFAGISPAEPPEEPPPGRVHLEAEELELSGGYTIDLVNPEWIMVSSSASQGEALGVFPGPDGEYQVTVHAIAEDDGQPELELWIGGGLQAVFTYPLGSSSREPVTLIGPTLFLTTGMEIRLRGIKDPTDGGAAHARVDVLFFELQ